MHPANFESIEEIRRKIAQISRVLDFNTFQDIARIFYDAIKISAIRLQRKKDKSKKKRSQFSLARKDIAKVLKLLTFFHTNDRYTQIKEAGGLAGCYYPNFKEEDAWKYCEKYIIGTIKDKYGNEIKFTDDFILSLYKDDEGKHVKDAENYNPTRAKRLPLVKDTIQKTTNIMQKIDKNDNLERMYVNRYIDFSGHDYYFAVIAKKFKKDIRSPFMAKTAFPIFNYNGVLRRIEKYEPAG